MNRLRQKQKSKPDTSRRSSALASGPSNVKPSSLAGTTSLAGGHVVKNRYGPTEKSPIKSKSY